MVSAIRYTQPDAVLETIGLEDTRTKIQQFEMREDLLATSGQAPVIELVNLILLDAVKGGASDVHFQPYRERLIVRYRIDGILFDAHTLPKAVQEEAISRVKVMGKMNIAEKRLPQDGRATVTVGDRLIDLRIAALPGSYGERVVLRLLDKSSRIYTLAEVGMDQETQERFRRLIELGTWPHPADRTDRQRQDDHPVFGTAGDQHQRQERGDAGRSHRVRHRRD